MESTDYKYGKLINETNRLIRSLSFCAREVSGEDVHYLLFHRRGVCSALADSGTGAGQMLVLSRFLGLVLTGNGVPGFSQGPQPLLSQLPEHELAGLVTSLLQGLILHHNSYFWTTVFVILNQTAVLDHLCHNRSALHLLIETVTAAETLPLRGLLKSSMLTVAQLVLRLLDHVSTSNSGQPIGESPKGGLLVPEVVRLGCLLVGSLLEDTGVGSHETRLLATALARLSDIDHRSPRSRATLMSEKHAAQLIRRMGSDATLNNVAHAIHFLCCMLPYFRQHLNQEEILAGVCRTGCELLQRTVDPTESCQLISLAAEIVFYGSQIDSKFLHLETNLKAIMGFIKILPNSGRHSDCRNVLWWHILCALPPNIFTERYKKYFIPFLENILGCYLDSTSPVTYGLSDYNLSRGHLNLSRLANHVILNLLDGLDLHETPKSRSQSSMDSHMLVPPAMKYARLHPSVLRFADAETAREFRTSVILTVNRWVSILRHSKSSILQQKRRRPHSSASVKTASARASLDNRGLSSLNVFESKRDSQMRGPFPCDELLTTDSEHRSTDPNPDAPSVNLIPEIEKSLVKPVKKFNKAVNTTKAFSKILPKLKSSELQNLLKFFAKNNQESNVVKRKYDDQKRLPLKKRNQFIEKSHVSKPKQKKITHKANDNSNAMDYLLKDQEDHDRDSNEESVLNGDISGTESTDHTEPADLGQPIESSLQDHKLQGLLEMDQSTSNVVAPTPITEAGVNTSNNSHLQWAGTSRCHKRNLLSSKLPKSHIDFTVNVTENSKPTPKSFNPSSSSPSSHRQRVKSKKVEFRIKFDLEPIAKLCLVPGGSSNNERQRLAPSGSCHKQRRCHGKKHKNKEFQDNAKDSEDTDDDMTPCDFLKHFKHIK